MQTNDNGNQKSEEICIDVNGKQITVNLNDPIYKIELLFGMKNMRFIINDRILLPSLSFKFFKIKNGDKLIAIPQRNQNLNLKKIQYDSFKKSELNRLKEKFDSKFSQNYLDPDFVFQKLINANDPNTKNESAMLSDLFKTKMENNPFMFRKICVNYLKNLSKNSFNEKDDFHCGTIIPSKSFSPSTIMLPDLC